MAEVTITIPNTDWSSGVFRVVWDPSGGANNISLGTSLSENRATELFLGTVSFERMSGGVIIQLSLSGQSEDPAGPDFSDQMESEGTITFVASDNSQLVITGIADSTEPYSWTPSNSAEVMTFATGLAGLADRSLTVTFNDNSIPEMAFNIFTAVEWSYSHPTSGALDIEEAAFNNAVLL